MTGSAVPRRMLGRELKKLRERSGVSAVVAAEAIEVSPQTLWRIESGQQGPKLKELYVRVLCEIYGAARDLTDALVSLVAETKKPGWWHSNFADLIPAHFDLFIGFEEIARRITSFQSTMVPGLLQTPAYRRAVAWMEFPNYPSSCLEPMLELHRHRVARLEKEADQFGFRVLLSESVLHNQVGGAGVMQEQLEHLASVGQAPNISIRIVPHRVGSHLGLLTGSFVLMEFSSHNVARLAEPPVVYVQGYTGALYLDQESEIDQYRQALTQIDRVALDEDKSRDLLLKAAREYLP